MSDPNTIVRLGDLMEFRAEFDNAAGTWRLVDLSGWSGKPSIVAQPVKRPGGRHGTYRPLEPSYDARYVSVVGEVRVHPSLDVRDEYSDVVSALTLDEYTLEVVESGLQPRYGFAVVDSASFNLFGHKSIGRLELRLRLDDPRKYGALETQQGESGSATAGGGLLFPVFDETGFAEFTETAGTNRIRVENFGTENTQPELYVDGPFSSFQFSSQGRIVGFNRAVPEGQSVRIDTATEMAWIGDSDVSGSLDVLNDEFFTVPPGGAWVQFSASSDGVVFSVNSRSAWT